MSKTYRKEDRQRFKDKYKRLRQERQNKRRVPEDIKRNDKEKE